MCNVAKYTLRSIVTATRLCLHSESERRCNVLVYVKEQVPNNVSPEKSKVRFLFFASLFVSIIVLWIILIALIWFQIG